MHLTLSRFWTFLWLCCLPVAAHAEFVGQVDIIIVFYAILFLGIPLAILLIYLLVRFLTRPKPAES
jgi:hypothetical protein